MTDDYFYCRSCNTHVTRYAHGNDCEIGDVVRLRDGHVVEVLGDVEAPVLTDHRR